MSRLNTLLLLVALVAANKKIDPADLQMTKYIEMTFKVGKQVLKDPIRIGLFGSDVPKAVQNFYELCTNRNLKYKDQKLSYIGTHLYRVIHNYVIQAGEFAGDKSISMWGEPFESEDLEIAHKAGAVSYLSTKEFGNGSLFVISIINNSHLDHKHQVFGRIVKGMDVIYQIDKLAGSPTGEPTQTATIHDCYDPYANDTDV